MFTNIFPMLETQNLFIGVFDIKTKQNKKKNLTITALRALFQYFLTIQIYFVGIFIRIVLLNTFLSTQTEFKSLQHFQLQ